MTTAQYTQDGNTTTPRQRPARAEIHCSPSIGGAAILSDYPVIEREGDDGPYKLATRRGEGGPISIAWVQEVRAVFRSDAHDLVVVTTDSASVYLMTVEEYEAKFDGWPTSPPSRAPLGRPGGGVFMLAPHLLQRCMHRMRVTVDAIVALLAFIAGLWAGTLTPRRVVRIDLLLPDQHKFLLDIWLTSAILPKARQAWETVPHYLVVALPAWPLALILGASVLAAMW